MPAAAVRLLGKDCTCKRARVVRPRDDPGIGVRMTFRATRARPFSASCFGVSALSAIACGMQPWFLWITYISMFVLGGRTWYLPPYHEGRRVGGRRARRRARRRGGGRRGGGRPTAAGAEAARINPSSRKLVGVQRVCWRRVPPNEPLFCETPQLRVFTFTL